MKHFCFAAITLLLTGCFKTDTEYTWNLVTENDKVWNIDEVIVQAMDNTSYQVVEEKTYTNVGTLRIKGTPDNCTYDLAAQIPLYDDTLGPIYDTEVQFSSDKLFFRDPIATQWPLFGADFIKLNKKEMFLFCSITYSVVFDAPYFFQFYFKCSKK